LDAPALLGEWVRLRSALALRHDIAEEGSSPLLEEAYPGQLGTEGKYRYDLEALSLRFGPSDSFRVRAGRQQTFRGAISDGVSLRTGTLVSGTELWAEAGQWADLYERASCTQCWTAGASLTQTWSGGVATVDFVELLDPAGRLAASQSFGSEHAGLTVEAQAESWFDPDAPMRALMVRGRAWWEWAQWELSASRRAAMDLTHPLVHPGHASVVAPIRGLEWPGFVELCSALFAVFEGQRSAELSSDGPSVAWIVADLKWRELEKPSFDLWWLDEEAMTLTVETVLRSRWVAAQLSVGRIEPLGRGSGRGAWQSATSLKGRLGEGVELSGGLFFGPPQTMELAWEHLASKGANAQLTWGMALEGLGEGSVGASYQVSQVVWPGAEQGNATLHQVALTWTLRSGTLAKRR